MRKLRFPCYISDTCDVMYNWSPSLLRPIVLNNLFDTCDVIYNWSPSLLRPIVLDNLFDTCDVVYNWSPSLLQPIVLDNLFDYLYKNNLNCVLNWKHSLYRHCTQSLKFPWSSIRFSALDEMKMNRESIKYCFTHNYSNIFLSIVVQTQINSGIRNACVYCIHT